MLGTCSCGVTPIVNAAAGIAITQLSYTSLSQPASLSSSASWQEVAYYSYTPVFSGGSVIILEYSTPYTISGSSSDTWCSQMLVDGAQVSYGAQQWTAYQYAGSGSRGSVLFPLVATVSSSGLSITIEIQVFMVLNLY